MKIEIRWQEGASFLGSTESGHTLLMDGPPEGGGRNQGPRPMETVLLGTGGCTAYDVVHILKRSRENVTSCEVRIEAERASQDPKVFTRIHFHFVLAGSNLKHEKVEQAIRLSEQKYCSASIMLGKTATISHSFEIAGSS